MSSSVPPPIPPPPTILSEPPPPHRAPIWISVVAVIVVAASAAGYAVGRGTAQGHTVSRLVRVPIHVANEQSSLTQQNGVVMAPELTFRIPSGWIASPEPEETAYPGSFRWAESLHGPQSGGYIYISAYNISYDGRRLNTDQLSEALHSLVDDYIAEHHGHLHGYFVPQTVGSVQVWSATASLSLDGIPWTLRYNYVLGNYLRIGIACWWTHTSAPEIKAACDTVVRSLAFRTTDASSV